METLRCVLLVCLLLTAEISAKTFGRCELAKLLVSKYGIPKNQIADWICLVNAESSYRTNAINKNTNGSKDYGLFQINNDFWCGENGPAKDCKVTCKALLTDDITKAVNCAKIIYRRHKFDAWYGWKNKCRGKNLSSYIQGCGI